MKNKKPNYIKNNPQNFVRLFFVVGILAIVVAVVFLLCKHTNLWGKINSIDKIKKIVESGGAFSFVIFMVLQILQTTILQVPAIIVTLAGTLIFGSWTAFGLSFVSVMIGSIIMFWLGRKLGRKFLYWIVGEKTSEKWIERMSHGKYLFFLMMVFPLFPDDILCAVAGITDMSFSFFFWVNVIARALGIGCTVFLGSGAVIPFSGWGIAVWGLIISVVVLLFYLSIKFQDKIDEVFKQIFSKKRKF